MNTRERDRGVTVAGLIQLFAVVLTLFVVVGFLTRGCWFNRATQSTTDDAKAFAVKMGETDPKVECTTYDTDGDGYVSCTVFRKDKDPVAIECARGFSMNSGCRLQKVARK